MSIRLSPLLIFSFCTTCIPLQGQQVFKTDKARWDYYLGLTRTWSPDAYEILMAVPGEQFAAYAAEGKTIEALLTSFNTVVHESCHQYNSNLTEDTDDDEG